MLNELDPFPLLSFFFPQCLPDCYRFPGALWILLHIPRGSLEAWSDPFFHYELLPQKQTWWEMRLSKKAWIRQWRALHIVHKVLNCMRMWDGCICFIGRITKDQILATWCFSSPEEKIIGAYTMIVAEGKVVMELTYRLWKSGVRLWKLEIINDQEIC